MGSHGAKWGLTLLTLPPTTSSIQKGRYVCNGPRVAKAKPKPKGPPPPAENIVEEDSEDEPEDPLPKPKAKPKGPAARVTVAQASDVLPSNLLRAAKAFSFLIFLTNLTVFLVPC